MNSSGDQLEYTGGFPALEGEELKVALPVILGVICLVGLVGNSLVVMVLLRDLKQGKSTAVHGLILLLSITELLLLLLCAPLRVSTTPRQDWSPSWVLCKSSEYLLHACLLAKSFTLAAVGHARYRQVSHLAKHGRPECPRVWVLACSTWVFALLLPIPQWLFSTAGHKHQFASCVFEVPPTAANFMSAYGVAYPLIAYGIPMTFAIVCHLKALLLHTPRRDRTPNRREPQARRVTLLLWGLSVGFTVMWLPDWVVWMWVRHRKPSGPRPPSALLILAQLLLFANGVLNPLALLTASQDFRDGVRSICQMASHGVPRARGSEGTAVLPSTLGQKSLGTNNALPTISGCREVLTCQDVVQNIPPDVQHFWQDRKNTAPPENNDPIPWERQGSS
ncbi:G-protein coupled receptor 151-like [Rhincodon typus]|uniref:G-protein coupled receptor 151-like n=1 Tax=Rhincodon typus TaxID=259920 RepID=UPI0009A28F8A|nr:G-protein coupled receptor 151-like [Rhincodon typus]